MNGSYGFWGITVKNSTIRIILILLIAPLVFLGCASLPKFSRVGGTKNADLHGIRIYNGQPPVKYPYERLGLVRADGHGAFTMMRLDHALENLSITAKEMGANAIINWRIVPRFGWVIQMEGEAVIFEEYPPLN